MLGPAMRRELLPMLKADGRSRSMFAEVLSTLKEDLRALGQAGFFRVQPGTESLNDHLPQQPLFAEKPFTSGRERMESFRRIC